MRRTLNTAARVTVANDRLDLVCGTDLAARTALPQNRLPRLSWQPLGVTGRGLLGGLKNSPKTIAAPHLRSHARHALGSRYQGSAMSLDGRMHAPTRAMCRPMFPGSGSPSECLAIG